MMVFSLSHYYYYNQTVQLVQFLQGAGLHRSQLCMQDSRGAPGLFLGSMVSKALMACCATSPTSDMSVGQEMAATNHITVTVGILQQHIFPSSLTF